MVYCQSSQKLIGDRKEREGKNAKKKYFGALCRINYRAVYSLGNEPIYFFLI